jgi:hypothetical protein
MAVLQIKGFSGVVPVTGDRALQDNFATTAVNTWLYGGELRGIRPATNLIACNSSTRRVLRIPRRTMGGDPAYPTSIPPPSYLGDSVWVQFTDIDTDIVKGQLVEDQYERYYFCSPTTGPMFNTYARLQTGLPAYQLGVPGPNVVYDSAGNNADKPTIVSITGGATPVLTRAYVYTWVNEFGEESAPSLPVTGAGNANAIWNIGNIKDPPAPTSSPLQPNWSKKFLYRTITGTSGQTTYYRVNTIALGTLTYADDASKITDAVLANNLTLESTNWAPPPATLKGWIAMPNGFLIGFDGNNIYMSESYHFHAWPAEYKYATETPVVGLGVLGQTCVVCTQGFPATVTGSKPATCSFTKATTGEPCMSRGSIVSTPDGVIYSSQNGLMLVGPGGINNVTQQLITKEEWTRDYAPQYLRAVRYQNGYLAVRMWPLVGGVPTPTRTGFLLDPTELRVALTELSDFDDVRAINTDFWSGEVFLIRTGMILRWDPPTTDLMPVQWVSKEFQYPFEENFGAYAIYWDDARYSNYDWGTSIMPTTEKIRLKVYADRNVVYDQLVPKNGRGVRLPSGFKADIWQFEIKARVPVYSLHVAATMKELKGV